MVQSLPSPDLAFAALSDATRRGVLERLGRADASISDLAEGFGMTLTGMKKHVHILEGAGLVTTEKVGRVRHCRLGPRRLEQETQWIAHYQQMLEARFDWWRSGGAVVVHSDDGQYGFEGRYGEVTPEERIVQTFEWDGMPAHVALETVVLEDLGDGRTRLTTTSQYHTPGDRDGMLGSDMEQGLAQGYAALDALLERLS